MECGLAEMIFVMEDSKQLSIPVACMIALTWLMGCQSLQQRIFPPQTVLDPQISKEQLVAHLNQNVVGNESRSGLVSWQASNAKMKVTGVPLPLPASIAVEAPRNLRILVSNPMGGREVDIGSNPDRFWIWTKEGSNMLHSRHEDVAAAIKYSQLPIEIYPDWLMEVFGVIPINGEEYDLVRTPGGHLQLVAQRVSPSGQTVEHVITVDPLRGVIAEHALREPGGSMIARAKLDKYAENPDGVLLPMVIDLQWPEAAVELAINLGRPQVNPPALAQNDRLWQMPRIPGSRPVDIGAIARQAVGNSNPQFPGTPLPPQPIAPVNHAQLQPAGRIQLPANLEVEAPAPASQGGQPSVPFQPTAHPWATN